MSLDTFLIFVAVSILPAISPGPAILLAISNSLRYGSRSVLYSALGNALGLTLLGFAVAFGLAAILAVSAAAFTIVKFIGAAYLIYLGVKLWRDGKSIALPGGGLIPISRGKLFRQAFFVSITNPKALIILAALIPPFIDRAQPVLPQVAIMSLTYVGLCFLNHLLLAFAGGRVRRFLASEARMTAVRRVLGSMFIGFGAALAAASR
jgi:threonine/homoserine/homoserine lactone efflux protein